jgi:hypothetical protein
MTTAKNSENVKNCGNLLTLPEEWLDYQNIAELGMDKGNISPNCNYEDNEPANTTVLIRYFLMKKWILLMEHHPCYPDWDPCDFLLFPPTKHSLKETHLSHWSRSSSIFNWYSGGWSPIGSTRHCCHQQAYCARPRWLWWWRNWWNDDWQGKPKYSEKIRPSVALPTTNPTCCPDANLGRRGGKPASNRLDYGTATQVQQHTSHTLEVISEDCQCDRKEQLYAWPATGANLNGTTAINR